MMSSEFLMKAVGIDVSKESLSVCLCSLKKDLEKIFIPGDDVSNNRTGFLQLSKWIKGVTCKKDELPIIVMEATGVYHEGVAYYLNNLGYPICIMQSGRVKKYSQSLEQRSKTDSLDSKMLSMLGCERKLPIWIPPGKTLQELRLLSRERSVLIKEKNRGKNYTHALQSSAYSHAATKKRIKKRLRLLDLQISAIELEMESLVSSDPVLFEKMELLESIPGVSFTTAAVIVGETLGFSMITSAKQLVSYSGYDVVIRESGNYKGKTRISKKGNHYIRAAMHMPSMTAIRLNPTLKPFYDRIKPNKVKPMIALVAVQRKLLVLMYSLWKNNTYYDAEYEVKKAARSQVLAAQDNNKPIFVTS